MRKLVAKLTGLDRIQKVLRDHPSASPAEFLSQVANQFDVESKVHGRVNHSVRSTIFFCTHHTGAIDLLTTYPWLSSRVSQLKVISNRQLFALKPMADISIGVDTLGTGKKNVEARSEMIKHLRQGGNILIYPAGKVGTLKSGQAVDFPWQTGIARILQTEARAAVPIFVDAQNPKIYYFFRQLFPRLNLLFLLSALRWSRRQFVHVYVGPALSCESFVGMTPDQVIQILREKTYSLKGNER